MLVLCVVIGWIAIASAVAIWAMKNAVEPPYTECFDCDNNSCAGCPIPEKPQETLTLDEKRLAA